LILGQIVPELGATLSGSVDFLGLGIQIEVSFLADTGTQRTCLMPSALALLPLSVQAQLASHLRPGPPLQGVGGFARTYEVPAALRFEHAVGEISEIRLNILLMVDQSYVTLPSILGLDVLFQGQVSAGIDGVNWDLMPAA
jgi:hypothetical protein